MPVIANITVKKKDGTTDIVYDALAGSGGDSSPAVWRQDTGAPSGLPVGLRAIARLFQAWNGPKTARVIRILMRYPYAVQDSTTTLYSAKDSVAVDISVTVPQSIPLTFVGEAVYQSLNIAASAAVKASAETGYAPT